MTFPENIDYIHFYCEAVKKGIKVSSRYAGVYIQKNRTGRLYFATTSKPLKANDKTKFKLFPFTSLGEKSAHYEYLRMIEGRKENRGRSRKLKLK